MNSLIVAEPTAMFVVVVSGNAKTRVVQVKSFGSFIILETLTSVACAVHTGRLIVCQQQSELHFFDWPQFKAC